MPRSFVVGNGSLHATFDSDLQMRDLYFPYVGMEDHTMFGHVHRTGVYVEGRGFAWFDDDGWERTIRYREDTLVGECTMRNDTLGVQLFVQDYVHPVFNILVRSMRIQNLTEQSLTVKCFFSHDFHLYGDKQKDTAFYEPFSNSVIHYRGSRYFLIGGTSTAPTECRTGVQGDAYATILKDMHEKQSCGLSAFTVGKNDYNGLEGTWRDAEDGELQEHTVEQGSVDSTVGIYSTVAPGEDEEVHLWLCAGKSLNAVLDLHQTVMQEEPERLERNCHNYWKSWVGKAQMDYGSLKPEHADLYRRSLLTVRLHCDDEGGILAAADSDIMLFNKDTYTYVWPRDGAFVSLALDAAGYSEVTRKFFRFCEKIQMPDGYMLHKYDPSGTLGSTWHAWYKDGQPQLPIQEDETALVVYALCKHFEQNRDFEFLQQVYEGFMKKAAQFMVDFRDESGLPLPSYDPWEEHRGVFTYTTACTIAGLHAAAEIAHILGHHAHSERYQDAADEMKQAMLFHLYDEEAGRFHKKIDRKDGETVGVDDTPDISMAVVWKLGVLSPDDPRVVSTMEQLIDSLTVQTEVGGLSRYTNDYYHSVVEPTKEIPGNPWILTTLWAAQWRIARAKSVEELQAERAVFDWCVERTSDAGMLAEQYNPETGEPLSVSPLTWSHATYIETVLQYLQRERDLQS